MSEHGYFLRITPYGSLSYEEIIDALTSIGIQKYFICYEEASRPHYHLCLFSPRGVENLRWNLKQRISGEVYLSAKEIEDKVRAIAYCMKDGNYIEKNIDINTWLLAKQVSFKKEDFDSDLKKLINNNEDSIKTLARALVELHIKYNKKIYRHHLKATMELIRAKRCDQYRDLLVNYILDEY